MELKGKRAVITGASGGIGLTIIKKLLKEGVICLVADQSMKQLDKIRKEIPDFFNNEKNYYVSGDFSDPMQTWTITDGLDIHNKKLDILINVAGIGIYKPIEKLEPGDIIKSVNINLTSPFLLIQGLIKALKKGSNPVVLNIGSGMGVLPEENRSAYCSTKFGLRGLSLSLYKELKGKVDICLLTLGSVMDSFGTGGIEKRKELEKKGKHYLSLDQVGDKIIKILKSEHRRKEYILYPNGYGK